LSGWIKLHRCLKDKAIFDNEKLLKVFIWCLLKATHKPHEQLVGRQKVLLQPGQFITGRNKAAMELNMAPSTAWEYLKFLETNNTINIESNNKFSIVTIVNWALYQMDDEISDNKSNNKPDNKSTTNQQQIDTNKNEKNDKNDKKIYKYIVEYLNRKCNKNFKHTTKSTQRLINARLNEGFSLDDFKKVIDIKSSQWLGTDMEKYLRPQTLFGTKFESYLNENEGGSVNNGKSRGNNGQNADPYAGIGFTAEDLQQL